MECEAGGWMESGEYEQYWTNGRMENFRKQQIKDAAKLEQLEQPKKGQKTKNVGLADENLVYSYTPETKANEPKSPQPVGQGVSLREQLIKEKKKPKSQQEPESQQEPIDQQEATGPLGSGR